MFERRREGININTARTALGFLMLFALNIFLENFLASCCIGKNFLEIFPKNSTL